MSKETRPAGPVLIPLEDGDANALAPFDPASAPPVPDDDADRAAQGRAMRAVARTASRPVSWLARLFWAAVVALGGLWLSTAAWDFVTGLFGRNDMLGWVAAGLAGVIVTALLIMALRELASLARLGRLDRLRAEIEQAAAGSADISDALSGLRRLYAGRADMKWALAEFDRHQADIVDADDRIASAEADLMTPLDDQARTEIEAATRQVATLTAIVPLTFADVAIAMTANLRMIRAIAETYGGRAGRVGSWRLLRSVVTHLVATGAVSVADDMLGSIVGGGAMGKISRRFGEGVVNGALTARVGVAAMDVCRPMPFKARSRPSVTGLVKSAVTGLIASRT